MTRTTTGGSVYRIKVKQLDQFRLYSKLSCITDSEKTFLLELMALSIDIKNQFSGSTDEIQDSIDISRLELQIWLKEKGIPAGDTILKKRFAELTNIGIFVKEKIQRPKCKPADLFILRDATDVKVLSAPEKTTTFSDHRPHRQRLTELREFLVVGDAQILDNNLPVRSARSERLWNGVFGSCMRSSRTDPRRNHTFTTHYRIGKDQITIITSSQSDSEICHVDDQRTIRAINTLVCMEIQSRREQGKEVKNEFFIDIVGLLAIMGLDGSGANRDTVRDSMKRLYGTNFNLIIDSQSQSGMVFAEQFGITPGADDLNYRFLTELDTSFDREYGGGNIRKPRWYRISLHSKTFADLIDPNVISTFIDNIEILKVPSGLLHLFYTWCSVNIKRSGSRVMTITMPELQKRLIPAARYDNFKERLISALKQYQKERNIPWEQDSRNDFNLMGYIIRMELDPINDYIFTAVRDKSDPVIGDSSIHNRLLRDGSHEKKGQTQLELN
ncbi:MAG: hypothetical protein EOO52_12690 [Gammaproteobacteria bacterium]|nr:MAG: hypothetical protein EOO52_12690 [Gammaproteobacteria bacterium]